MRAGQSIVVLLILALCVALPAFGQAPRQDYIWARNATSSGPITLDGNLNETCWTYAESIVVRYGRDTGVPGSGWKAEAGANATDSTYATLKFVVVNNQLYLGANVHDKSVGGSKDFNRFDGFLISLKDHSNPNFPKPPAEYTYLWWYPTTNDPQPPGESPSFVGRWATWPPGSPRTPEQVANWDAVTVVHGLSNDDSVIDTGYTVEMRFNLTPMGYDVTRTQGDTVEWNISIYDCDWNWPFQNSMSSNRVWWQSPWDNDIWYDEVRIFSRPSVNLSAPLPGVAPDVVIPNGVNETTPVIDGQITDQVWSRIAGTRIMWGNSAIRQGYPGVGPYRSGQFQPTVNGGQAAVTDPGDATFKTFFKDHTLYMAFDVRDRFVQYHVNYDRWDGFVVSLNDVVQRNPDHVLLGRRLSFQVNQDGTALPHDYLATLVQSGGAQVAIHLNPGTTVDTLGLQMDNGYTAEMAVDLTQLGYPANLGDGTLFLGVDLLDGDSFDPPSDSYGTRTWWFREHESNCCPAWCYMNPSLNVSDVASQEDLSPLKGDVQPNPFRDKASIRFALREARAVTLEVYDVQGRLVERRALGICSAGPQSATLDGTGKPAGIYMYRLSVSDPQTGAATSGPYGRAVLLK